MTDVQPPAIAPRRSPVPRPGHPKKPSHGVPKTLSTRMAACLSYMVHGGPDGLPVSRRDAAKLANLSDETVRKAFRNPEIVKAYNHELEVLRTSERARNLHTAIGIRDDADMAKSAAGNGVRLHAARFIEGRDGPGAINVNVNTGVALIPGYQVAMGTDMADAGRQMLKLAGSTRSVADISHDVPTDGQGTPE